MSIATRIFDSSFFMPHGHCYLWRPEVLWLNVVSDGLIALAYFAIPFALIYFVKKREDLAFNWIFMMFAMFIVACGLTHLMSIWTVWNPDYGLEGMLKLLTAIVSLATAGTLWPMMPRLLALPSAKQLELVNKDLRREIAEKDTAKLRLKALSEALERRVEDRTIELNHVNESLTKQAEHLKSVVNHVVDGIITINQEFMIESWNAAAKIIFDYDAADVVGKNVNMLMPEPYHSHHDSYVANYLRTGDAKIIGIGREVVGKRRDGTTFPMDLAVSEFKLGKKRFFTGIVRDITERKKAAEELKIAAEDLKAAKEAAEAANHAKSQFLANMSHEIRTPLGAVLGFSDLMGNPNISASERINYLGAIKRNGELLSNIINDILDLTKVEAGKLDVEKQAVPLREILTDIVSLCNLQALDRGIQLTVASDGPVPRIIKTDPLRLKQILLNIVGNAVKFTRKGSVEVRVKQDTTNKAGIKVAFIIKDSGPGIEPRQAAKLFAPFTQADATIKRKHGGTGLGLVLAKRLAKLLGGDVALTASTPGVGSTFTVTIDPGQIDQTACETFDSQGRVEVPAPVSTHEDIRLDGIKVLVVDDSPDNRFLVSKMLRFAGATVDAAGNGVEALAKVQKNTYDALLMDLQMPVMDGFEATAELRREGHVTPIIALTAHALKEEQQRCFAAGFSDHLSKPIDRKSLLETVAHHAGSARL